MGHYHAAGHASEPMLSTSSTVFDAFKAHCSEPRINTSLTLLEHIRRIHVDKHVTVVAVRSCDLLGFAKAGHAQCRSITSDGSFASYRTYNAPTSRLNGGDGKLGDHVSFGTYEYEWEGRLYPFYAVSWQDPASGSESYFYLLTPKPDVNAAGHSPSADRLTVACGRWTSQLHEEIDVFDSGFWSKNHELWASVQNASWDDVILDPVLKNTLIDDVEDFFHSRALYEEYSVPWKRGIIFHGTPGCGKTISIKALMKSLQSSNVASLYVKSFDACQGAQYSIRTIFARARNLAPCLLIFEDLDSLVKDDVRSYFLNEVDGLTENNGILMIGSTNHLERLDPGISKRPSRFDRKYHYNLPGKHERILYCEYWKKKLSGNSKIEFHPETCEIVAQLTEGFSFAYMKELFVQTLLAIVGGRVEVTSKEMAIQEKRETDITQSTKAVDGSAKLAEQVKGTIVINPSSELTSDEIVNAKHGNEELANFCKIPEVDIPNHLQSDLLLRVLRKQVVSLIKDMDSISGDGPVSGRSKI